MNRSEFETKLRQEGMRFAKSKLNRIDIARRTHTVGCACPSAMASPGAQLPQAWA